MMGTQNAAVEGRSGASALVGAKGAPASGELGEDGEFTGALEEQLGGLLVELGVDPKTLEGMDIEAMLAQLQALLKGQVDAAGGDTLPLLDAEASGADISLDAEMPLDAEMSLGALLKGDAESGPSPEVQAALAALLQQWSGQSGAELGDIEALSSRIGQAGGDVSATDLLAFLKASLATSNRSGAEQGNAAAEGAKTLDLTRLLTPDGARQLADRLSLIARARDGMAEIKLSPPSLGAMEVRVTMEADKAHVHFVSANPAVREVLEAALPKLREALAQDGLSLGDASVSDQPPQSRDEAAGEGVAAGDGEGGGDADSEQEALLAAEGAVASSTLSRLARKLDLFA
ncbi:flagellar hook-length control protein FliK [Thiorhodovibrio frisius]|uniref:Flagellar hook-length control protein n=1 Tax=Thiorhodovibrio frisius TaxID=631362 RepID=H8YZ28_9GAMM|nr:flagellar hook-length control protein FliK [Thiorhodovibrio frisius]EIC21955.1 flagellar hook-length control protein [Thiorhodovibrio frisius]WPL24244.1 Flagellar hook-length control protein [Thiorhodovibrio frisius]